MSELRDLGDQDARLAHRAGKAPPGYRARRRTEVEGKTVEEIDELVEAAGGWIERQPLQSRGLRPGRLLVRFQTVDW